MNLPSETTLWSLLEALVGTRRTERLFEAVAVPRALLDPWTPRVPRGILAMAMSLLVFETLLERVPWAQAYVRDRVRTGGQVVLDHCAVRTVKALSGLLPEGAAGFTRILEPLGYRRAASWPMAAPGLTGIGMVHRDHPEDLPQVLLGEFNPEGFSPAFQAAVARTLAGTRDALPLWAYSMLEELKATGGLSHDQALRLLPNLVACFDCQHGPPELADHDVLRAESPVMAWFATEGHACHHVTDRVPDAQALAREQRALGRTLEEEPDLPGAARALKAALPAAEVARVFRTPEGDLTVQRVPGSFLAFMTRMRLPDGRLDLGLETVPAPGGAELETRSAC